MSESKGEYRIEGREKTIFRTVHDPENPYVTINSTPITSPSLSFKAKGILTYLLSRPDGWEVNVPDLVNHSTDGPAAVRSGLMELRKAGHIHYNTQREGGYIKKWVIEVYEIPFKSEGNKSQDEEVEKVLDSDFQQVENQQVGNQHVGNRGEVLSTLSINELNKSTTTAKPPEKVAPSQETRDTTQNVFTFYQNNIAMITPVMAEVLKDAEQEYGPVWVCEAISEAVKSNARQWKYCEAILKRWKRDGFKSEKPKNQSVRPIPAQKSGNPNEDFFKNLAMQKDKPEVVNV